MEKVSRRAPLLLVALLVLLLLARSTVAPPPKDVEARLLGMLGLSRRPRPAPDLRVPPFMLDLWKRTTAVQRRSRRSAVPPYNTVRAYPHEGSKHLPDGHLWFDIKSLPLDEVVHEAELKVDVGDKAHVQVFDVIRPANYKDEALLRLIDSRPVLKPGLASFDVMPALSRWRAQPGTNHGLVVKTQRLSSEGKKHIITKRSLEAPVVYSNQTHLVTYSADKSYASTVRNSNGGSNKATRRRRAPRKNKKKRKGNTCRRHRMYVDFIDVGWNNWIVAPPGYNAFYCYGECKFPLSDHLNTTNHAIVQSLVNSANPMTVPRACCVPTELSSISMLYINEHDKVVLKNYQDMVVEGCGCR